MTARHLRISGVVQGVGYRAAFERRARVLGLSGWVRNRSDGTVEAVVAGSEEALNEIIVWSQRGPAMARVDDVAVMEAAQDAAGDAGFRVLPTA
ncbi:acylphosphatase [Noviherbaspirillum humi]|uniref:acylphosphatase n=1 Tax=Noviherbaspirillum humi TaxID=1688639 RepID=A0A239JEP4_9BURK|nr:acylphosphatase [Noviherbaspirillum humi]SNT04295.1 acylphosphatase [Noviherbaspirillum humi]